MPSKKFEDLKTTKKERILTALKKEFARHSLASVQVARIVKSAEIARGSFYVYFADVDDAYLYAYQQAMKQLHQPLHLTGGHLPTVDDFLTAIRQFLNDVDQQDLRQWMIFHIQINEGLLHAHGHQLERSTTAKTSDYQWAVQTLIHQSINEAIVSPVQQDQILRRLGTVLHQLEGKL